MGFLDKAKQLADQAQQKLDEVQKDFNKQSTGQQQQGDAPAVEYDKHGRPIQPAEPEAPVAPPAAQQPAPPPQAAPPGEPAQQAEPAAPPQADHSFPGAERVRGREGRRRSWRSSQDDLRRPAGGLTARWRPANGARPRS
jgi:hypothetical protein